MRYTKDLWESYWKTIAGIKSDSLRISVALHAKGRNKVSTKV